MIKNRIENNINTLTADISSDKILPTLKIE
ncbi:hypothetical protein TSYNT_9150 [Tepidanaerobacter syntrophicus]|uniref:Uncharacterized protein n=1 Tax=Tepidanaerobacter syntrophicus TaxID=224999 RepID=A0A0U9HKJ9_9FIRM|nr:hypothetical protein TSYNT_9150 [Tepidanaerobacter syntrophicus]